MGISEVTELITTVGFPIVVAGALFWQGNKTQVMYMEMLKEFREVINNNTHSIIRLTELVNEMSDEK